MKLGASLLLIGTTLTLTACSSDRQEANLQVTDQQNLSELTVQERKIQEMSETDVLLLSDHTLPHHLNLSSGGANGEERLFIDPTLLAIQRHLTEFNIRSVIMDVEEFAANNDIQDKTTFDAAYADYDAVLNEAVKHGVTIIAVHYDADVIPGDTENVPAKYIGGAQVILDSRAARAQSVNLANAIIFDGKILDQLEQLGLRIRPDYDDEIRYQNNLTLNIIGHSSGGGILLEIGAQEQAQKLFGTPEQIVSAIDPVMFSLASTLANFRTTLSK